MKFFQRFFALNLLFNTVLLLPARAQSPLISELNDKVIPLKTVLPGKDFTDLNRLQSILKDKRIVALGEATHGTREFFTFKDRMIRYLISNYGFKTIVIESDFAGTQALNNYILYGKGTLVDGLQKMAVGVWFTEEFANMVEWIKSYNQDKDLKDKVKFYGCDMQFAFTSAMNVADGTISLNKPLSPEARKGLDFISKRSYAKIGKEDLSAVKILSAELTDAAVVEPDTTLSKFYSHQVKTICQTIEYAMAPDWFKRDIIRDRYMAKNCEWIYNHESKEKMIVWAHNLHVAKDITRNNNQPMGHYLKQSLGDAYYVMGFGFNSGTLNGYNREQRKSVIYTIPEVKIKKSADYVFKQVEVPNFILDFNSASNKPLIKDFLDQKLNARSIGGHYDEKKQADGGDGSYQPLAKMYDAMIFLRNTTAATPYRATITY